VTILARLFPCVLLLGPAQAWAQAVVPMHQEPRHRLVLDSIRFRVLDVRIRPGDTTLFHRHDSPVLYVDVGVSPTVAQVLGEEWASPSSTADPARRPGNVRLDSAYLHRPVTHRVTNVGAHLFRLIAVTSASSGGGARASGSEYAMPGVQEVSSTWFRQTRVRIAPDTGTAWYSSPSPVVVIQPLDSRTEVIMASGARRVLQAPGDWALVQAGTRYRLQNRGVDATNVVVVQIR
jgi:quercetin dioxygenase-like cupin family protein